MDARVTSAHDVATLCRGARRHLETKDDRAYARLQLQRAEASMAVTSGAPSKMSLSVSGSIVSGDGDELRVVAGKVSRRSAERYLEFVVPSADLTVRASWKPRDAKGRARDDAMPLALAINGSKPVDVVARAGKLYRRDERGTSTKPFEDERLGELGRVLLAIK